MCADELEKKPRLAREGRKSWRNVHLVRERDARGVPASRAGGVGVVDGSRQRAEVMAATQAGKKSFVAASFITEDGGAYYKRAGNWGEIF
eukprot:scaffold570_cov95-Isochrysis_galbana.AAC.2